MGSGNDGRTLTQTEGIWLSASRNLECSDMGEITITDRAGTGGRIACATRGRPRGRQTAPPAPETPSIFSWNDEPGGKAKRPASLGSPFLLRFLTFGADRREAVCASKLRWFSTVLATSKWTGMSTAPPDRADPKNRTFAKSLGATHDIVSS